MSNYNPSNKDKPLLIDFKRQGASEEFFPNPPLLTSNQSGWSGIHFEHHKQPSFDTLEHRLTMHNIAICLTTTSVERWLDGVFQKENLIPGTIPIIPAHTLHRSVWFCNTEFMFIGLEPALLEKASIDVAYGSFELIPHFAIQQDYLIQGITFSLKEELESISAFGNLYVEQLISTLIIHLLKKYCITKLKKNNCNNGLPKYKLNEIIDYIQANIDENIKLNMLAQLAGMSQYYFCQVFKQSMGVSPYQYVLLQRVEKAKQLLKSCEMSISDVAVASGFANQSHFTKHFHKLTGITPKAYKES